MSYKTRIAANIKNAIAEYEDRHHVKLTYPDLSRLCGDKLSATRLSNYANAIRMPGPGEANIMSNALECDAAWLMCLKSELSPDEAALLRNIRALPENERKSYMRRIEVLSMAYRDPVPDDAPPAPKARKRVN